MAKTRDVAKLSEASEEYSAFEAELDDVTEATADLLKHWGSGALGWHEPPGSDYHHGDLPSRTAVDRLAIAREAAQDLGDFLAALEAHRFKKWQERIGIYTRLEEVSA
jgi:hypothetical protein